MSTPYHFQIDCLAVVPQPDSAVDISGDGFGGVQHSRAVPGIENIGDADMQGDGLHETNPEVIGFGDDLAQFLGCDNPALEIATPEEIETRKGDPVWRDSTTGL